MRHTITALFLLSAALCLAGCGQTGPLYLPEDSGKAGTETETVSGPDTGTETPTEEEPVAGDSKTSETSE